MYSPGESQQKLSGAIQFYHFPNHFGKMSSVDVAVITESWCHSYIDSTYISIPGYFLCQRDRPDREGGGVCTFVTTGRVSGKLIWSILFSNACGYGFGLTSYHVHSQSLSAGLFTFLRF